MNIPLSPVGWIAKLVMEKVRGRLIINVGVHDAYLQGMTTSSALTGSTRHGGQPAWFINVHNASPRREITITHVWLDTTPPIAVMAKRLPAPVGVGREWETYLLTAAVPPGLQNVQESFRVRVVGGRTFKSKKRTNVPPVGYVPNG